MTRKRLVFAPLVLIVAGLVGFVYGLWAHARTWGASSWLTVDGEITVSMVRRGGAMTMKGKTRVRSRPDVAYEYTVDGVEYTCRRVNVAEGEKTAQGSGCTVGPGGSLFSPSAREVVERYPVGSRVEVFYDPDDPNDAALEIEAPRVAALGLWAGIPLAIIGWFVFRRLKSNLDTA